MIVFGACAGFLVSDLMDPASDRLYRDSSALLQCPGRCRSSCQVRFHGPKLWPEYGLVSRRQNGDTQQLGVTTLASDLRPDSGLKIRSAKWPSILVWNMVWKSRPSRQPLSKRQLYCEMHLYPCAETTPFASPQRDFVGSSLTRALRVLRV